MTRLKNFYCGKTILVTGHTGFKGSWLCEWLLDLGAEVHGYSLAPATHPSLFEQLQLQRRICQHVEADIRDRTKLRAFFKSVQPQVMFHLAAQPLVRESYRTPGDTYETNVMGTLNVLESLRDLQNSCSAVLITTDKVYENREDGTAYDEASPLGGYDPYSSSKACCDIAISSWRRSYFAQHPVKICSVRAGNVIGGGDWAEDRLVPDIMRALSQKETVILRNPTSTRPWQHVLEPLAGYLLTAQGLAEGKKIDSLNFGPHLEANRSVRELVGECLKRWPGHSADQPDPNAPHEANLLALSIEKAKYTLGWTPKWDFASTIARTVNWYKAVSEGQDPIELTQQQIEQYAKDMLG